MGKRIKTFLENRKKKDLYRELSEITYLGSGKIKVKDKGDNNFSSNEYLGLSTHCKIIESVKNKLFPVYGTASSR